MDLMPIESRSGAVTKGSSRKDTSAPYIEGRSTKWLKVKIRHKEEFVIAGYTAPSGSRKYFGALLLGGYRDRNCTTSAKWEQDFQPVLAALFKKFRSLVHRSLPWWIHRAKSI